MKFLVGTKETQGQRENDFSWTFEGEPVFPGVTCSRAVADDSCGCARSLGALITFRATTTARVVETDSKPEALAAIYAASCRAQGWMPTDEEELEQVKNMDMLLTSFTPGSVVEYRDGLLATRP